MSNPSLRSAATRAMYRSRCTIAYAERLLDLRVVVLRIPRRRTAQGVQLGIGQGLDRVPLLHLLKLDQAPDATAAGRAAGTHSPRFGGPLARGRLLVEALERLVCALYARSQAQRARHRQRRQPRRSHRCRRRLTAASRRSCAPSGSPMATNNRSTDLHDPGENRRLGIPAGTHRGDDRRSRDQESGCSRSARSPRALRRPFP